MTEKERKILHLFFNAHLAPSEIDRVMCMPDGTAHDHVIWAWNHMGEAMSVVKCLTGTFEIGGTHDSIG